MSSNGRLVSTMDETYVRLYPDLELHHFWWKIRRRLVGQLISNRVDLTRCSVLDIGCGSGVTMEYLSDAGAAAVRGIEIDPLALRPDSPINDRIVLGDLLDLKIDEIYDIVVMLDVLEHIEDDRSALAKVAVLYIPRRVIDSDGAGVRLALVQPRCDQCSFSTLFGEAASSSPRVVGIQSRTDRLHVCRPHPTETSDALAGDGRSRLWERLG